MRNHVCNREYEAEFCVFCRDFKVSFEVKLSYEPEEIGGYDSPSSSEYWHYDGDCYISKIEWSNLEGGKHIVENGDRNFNRLSRIGLIKAIENEIYTFTKEAL